MERGKKRMANSDSDIRSDSSDDQSAHQHLRRDLRELPKLRTQDDFLLRVKARIEADAPAPQAQSNPVAPSHWNLMRGRMTFISSIAALGLIAVVTVTLLRNPAVPIAVPAARESDAIPETVQQNTATPALADRNAPSAQSPAPEVARGPAKDSRVEMQKPDRGSVREELLDRKQAPVSPSASGTVESDRNIPATRRADAEASGGMEAKKTENALSSSPHGATRPVGQAAEKNDAPAATMRDNASGVKAKPSFEQEYVPIQKKELVKMRTGHAVQDSASVRDSVEVRSARPR
jgi:hypothetical protein